MPDVVKKLVQNTCKKRGMRKSAPFCIIFNIEKEVERKDEEEKEKSSKGEIFLKSHVETEVSAADVSAVCYLAYYLQVCSLMGVDDGIPGGKARNLRSAGLGEGVCGA